MAVLELEVVELMAKHTTRLTGLVEMIRGLANPKSGGARRGLHLHPHPCLKCAVSQGRRGGKDCTGIIKFDVVRQERDVTYDGNPLVSSAWVQGMRMAGLGLWNRNGLEGVNGRRTSGFILSNKAANIFSDNGDPLYGIIYCRYL
jgi:hypothetical protein